MARTILALILSAFVSLASAQQTFKIAYNETTAPMVPLVRAIYAEIGIAPSFVLLPSERGITDTNAGKYDADLSRAGDVVAQYAHVVHTNEPFAKIELLAYVKKGSAITITSVADIREHKLGYLLGSKFIDLFLNQEGLHADAAATAENFYRMLDAGRFEVALVTTTQLLSQASQLGTVGKRAGPALRSDFSYHVVNKKHAALIAQFDAVLKAMKADGRMLKYLKAP